MSGSGKFYRHIPYRGFYIFNTTFARKNIIHDEHVFFHSNILKGQCHEIFRPVQLRGKKVSMKIVAKKKKSLAGLFLPIFLRGQSRVCYITKMGKKFLHGVAFTVTFVEQKK